MSKLIMLAGPSGSGKSTYAQQLANFQDQFIMGNIAIVSSDTTRAELYGDANDMTDHQRVFDLCHRDMQHHLNMGRTVIFDATNLVAKWRADPLTMARATGATCELHYFTTIAEICLRRQKERDREVPSEVIGRQVHQRVVDLNRPIKQFYDEGFEVVRFIR